ncbi:hypothetical protein C7W93_06450 [Glaciimonas sp. PCH181]|nr:hypothetical protein C7W93_06450 [Glaciimonas sp. PCH181]
MFGTALPSLSKEFHLDPAQAGMLATLGLVGAFLGALFWGTISDYIGRRTAFKATVGIFAVFTGLTAASWNLATLGIARFGSNFGLGGEVPVATTLVSEFMPSSVRGRATGLMMAAFPLGLVISALLSLAIVPTYGWRPLFVIGIIPAALLYFVRRHMPESVRYLLSRGRVAEAQRTVDIITESALDSNASSPIVNGTKPLVKNTNLEETISNNPGVTFLDLLAPEHRRRTILLWIVSFCFLWSSNGILFMLPTILTQRGFSLSQAIGFQLIQAIFAVAGYSVCAFLIDRYGRRPVLFFYYFVGAAFHLWFATANGMWMVVAIAFVGWVNPGVFGASAVYAAELYPTRIRATAVGWFFGIGRIGSFLAPAVIGYMLANNLGKYVLHTFALTYLLAAIALYLIGIETKGVLLEEIDEEEVPAH